MVPVWRLHRMDKSSLYIYYLQQSAGGQGRSKLLRLSVEVVITAFGEYLKVARKSDVHQAVTRYCTIGFDRTCLSAVHSKIQHLTLTHALFQRNSHTLPQHKFTLQ